MKELIKSPGELAFEYGFADDRGHPGSLVRLRFKRTKKFEVTGNEREIVSISYFANEQDAMSYLNRVRGMGDRVTEIVFSKYAWAESFGVN